MRSVLSKALACFISLVLSYFFKCEYVWLMPITTLFVMQTAIGNLLYQGLLRTLFILILVLILSSVFWLRENVFMLLSQVVVGAIIGMLANLFLFPRRPDVAFRAAILPVIQTYQLYFQNNVLLFLQDEKNANPSLTLQMEQELLALPDWVYAKGFDVGLQKGHQFFLLTLEQISDVLFAMHYFAQHDYFIEIIHVLREPIEQCAQQIDKVFAAILAVINLKKEITHIEIDDVDEALIALESVVQKNVPWNLELLDINQDNVPLVAFVGEIRALRDLLFRLISALRVGKA